jgi:spermidine synthase
MESLSSFPGGIVCTQAESQWYHMEIIKSLAAMCKKVFVGGTVQYGYTTIPTYPSGQIGFMVCTKKGDVDNDPRVSKRDVGAANAGALGPLKYYNRELHAAAFTLPTFARDALKGSLSF